MPNETQTGQTPAVPSPEAPDLSFVPTDFHVEGKPDLTKFRDHYQDLVAADAQRREALADVPEDGIYVFALPDDLKFDGLDLPEGFAVTLDTESEAMKPLYAEMGAILKELGAPRAAAGKVGALIARYEAARFSEAYAAQKAEMAKLGPTADARVGSVQRKLQATLPAEQAEALAGATRSAAALQALEKLLAPKSMPAPAAVPNTAGLEGLTPFERLKKINEMQAKAS